MPFCRFKYYFWIFFRIQNIAAADMFNAISGELKYQPEKQVAEMRVTIPVNALNTGVDAFDKPAVIGRGLEMIDIKYRIGMRIIKFIYIGMSST